MDSFIGGGSVFSVANRLNPGLPPIPAVIIVGVSEEACRFINKYGLGFPDELKKKTDYFLSIGEIPVVKEGPLLIPFGQKIEDSAVVPVQMRCIQDTQGELYFIAYTKIIRMRS